LYIDALTYANNLLKKNRKACGGITRLDNGEFQLRMGKSIKPSSSGERSWILQREKFWT
jgi:hypothetical protein